MSIVAIVSEYNPFHNGHKYQLELAKEITGSDYSISIMSGNFLQRGVPAIMNKYCRAAIAASNGIDIVFELPFVYATASARDFATASVSMMNKLGIVDYISFGAEADDINVLFDIAEVIANEPDSIGNTIRTLLSHGYSYPIARKQAYIEYFNNDHVAEIIASPNNILAIEYLAALIKTNSNIKPILIRRKAAGYNSTEISSGICSATAIRQLLFNNNTCNTVPSELENVVPATTYMRMCEEYFTSYPIFDDDISNALIYSRIYNDISADYVDMDKTILNRMNKAALHMSFSELSASLKSKNITLSHINRGLLHYIFKLTKNEYEEYKNNGYIYYAKLLSLRKNASSVLKDIYKSSMVPIINKTADGISKLSDYGLSMFSYDQKATSIYNQIVYDKFGTVLSNDFTQTISII